MAAVMSAQRRDLGKSQQDVANVVGWSRDKLAKIENGQGKCEFGEVCMVADALGVPRETVIRRILAWNG